MIPGNLPGEINFIQASGKDSVSLKGEACRIAPAWCTFFNAPSIQEYSFVFTTFLTCSQLMLLQSSPRRIRWKKCISLKRQEQNTLGWRRRVVLLTMSLILMPFLSSTNYKPVDHGSYIHNCGVLIRNQNLNCFQVFSAA